MLLEAVDLIPARQILPALPADEIPALAREEDAARARTSTDGASPPSLWRLERLSGRLVELSAHTEPGRLSAVATLLKEAQAAGEPTVWITGLGSSFYPPDLADSGVQLAALAVIRVENLRDAQRATDRLLRSGAFGLVVLDLCDLGRNPVTLPLPVQTRLAGLAQRHDSAVLLLTEKGEALPSLGSLVNLRVEARRRREGPGRFRVELRALKDKRRGPGWRHSERYRGTAGLR